MRSFESMLADLDGQATTGSHQQQPQDGRRESPQARSRKDSGMTTANTSKRLFVKGVGSSYELIGWVILGISAMLGIPPFYLVMRRITDGLLTALQLPSALESFLGKLVWGIALLACCWTFSKVWQLRKGWVVKLGLMAFVAFVGFTLFQIGSANAITLITALAIWALSIACWWKIQTLQLVPFIIYRNRQAAEKAAQVMDGEHAKGHRKIEGMTDADRIRSLASANDSMTQQLSNALTAAFFAYAIEGTVDLFAWMPNPLETLGNLWRALFVGGFWAIIIGVLFQIFMIGLTCTLTEIAALQLIGTEKVSRLIKFEGEGA